jgi:ankyrin repeat protein
MSLSVNLSSDEILLLSSVWSNSLVSYPFSYEISKSDVDAIVREKDVTRLVLTIQHNKTLVMKLCSLGLPVRHMNYDILMFAISMKDETYVSSILHFVDNVNEVMENSTSPLHKAVMMNNPNIVSLLLAKGANPNTIVNGYTAFHLSIQARREKIIKLMVDNGGNLDGLFLSPSSGEVYKIRKIPFLSRSMKDYINSKYYSLKFASLKFTAAKIS